MSAIPATNPFIMSDSEGVPDAEEQAQGERVTTRWDTTFLRLHCN